MTGAQIWPTDNPLVGDLLRVPDQPGWSLRLVTAFDPEAWSLVPIMIERIAAFAAQVGAKHPEVPAMNWRNHFVAVANPVMFAVAILHETTVVGHLLITMGSDPEAGLTYATIKQWQMDTPFPSAAVRERAWECIQWLCWTAGASHIQSITLDENDGAPADIGRAYRVWYGFEDYARQLVRRIDNDEMREVDLGKRQ